MAVTDFIALDVETANADLASICAIGLVHFRQGAIFKEILVLVDPEDRFDAINISIHGITQADVAGKPTMPRVFAALAPSLTDVVVAHHSPFDRAAMIRAAQRYGVADLECEWVDTLQVARHSWKALSERGGFGLRNLSQYLNLDLQHHSPTHDARCCGEILLRAINETGISLDAWLDKLSGKRVYPQRVKRDGAGTGPLAGEIVVFTGELSMPRKKAADEAAASGAAVIDHISKKVTILVVGDQDLRATKGQEKSSKHRKAEELIAEGAQIRIVKESDFRLLLR